MVGRFHAWAPAVGCSIGAMVGAEALQAAALQRWAVRGATSGGIFNCRRVAGGLAWSVHAEGRAGDIMVPRSARDLGDAIVRDLLEAAWGLGLQRIIWHGYIYDANRPAGQIFEDGGAHDDHVHWEQTREASRSLTAASAAALLPPDGTTEDDVQMDLLVRWGGLWIVAHDLSSKTPLASTADVTALQATGKYVLTSLTAAQMVKIPSVDAVNDGDA